MNILIVFVLAIATVCYASHREEWLQFKVKHNKRYQSQVEETSRFSIFQENLRKINLHNLEYENGESSYTMGVNQFADLTAEEFKETMGLLRNKKPVVDQVKTINLESYADDIPDAFDWVPKGAVTGVKDQAQCGSCWSFSATGTIEGAYFLQTGKLLSLSEQNLVDCDSDCFGCGGGYMDKALDYVKLNGIMTEEDYPYEGVDDTCKYNQNATRVTIKSYVKVKTNDENELKKAVALMGPVSVAIDATNSFQLYSSGVMDDKFCGNTEFDMDHGVLVTGYGTLNGKDYWIVKNSWGTTWGQKGYIWMSRNANSQCGIALEPLYPQM